MLQYFVSGRSATYSNEPVHFDNSPFLLGLFFSYSTCYYLWKKTIGANFEIKDWYGHNFCIWDTAGQGKNLVYLSFLTHSFILSFSHSFILLFSHSFILLFSHSFILLFSHSFILLFSLSFILSFSHSFILSFSHSFSYSLTLSFSHSFSYSLTLILSLSFSHSLILLYHITYVYIFSNILEKFHALNEFYCRNTHAAILVFGNSTHHIHQHVWNSFISCNYVWSS
jgi:hypothetical protein